MVAPTIFRVLVSEAGRLTSWEDTAVAFFGTSPAGALGRTFADVLGPAARPADEAVAAAVHARRRKEARVPLAGVPVVVWVVPLAKDRILVVGRRTGGPRRPSRQDADAAVEEARVVAETLVEHLRVDQRSEAVAMVELATTLDIRLAILAEEHDPEVRQRLDAEVAALLDQLHAAVESLRRDALTPRP